MVLECGHNEKRRRIHSVRVVRRLARWGVRRILRVAAPVGGTWSAGWQSHRRTGRDVHGRERLFTSIPGDLPTVQSQAEAFQL
jgi:hypothetical protein